MMALLTTFSSVWWLVRKDLLRERSVGSVLPSTLMLGISIVFVLTMELDLPSTERTQAVAGLLWVAVAFGGTLALERSVLNERDGCWQAMALYPVAPGVVYLAKLIVNFALLMLVVAVLTPVFMALSDVPLLARPASFLLVAVLGSLSFAAVGTLLSAVMANLQRRSGLFALLLLPLMTPVLIGSAESTRLMLADDYGRQWWYWIQFLSVFAAAYTILGGLIFDYVVEE